MCKIYIILSLNKPNPKVESIEREIERERERERETLLNTALSSSYSLRLLNNTLIHSKR